MTKLNWATGVGSFCEGTHIFHFNSWNYKKQTNPSRFWVWTAWSNLFQRQYSQQCVTLKCLEVIKCHTLPSNLIIILEKVYDISIKLNKKYWIYGTE